MNASLATACPDHGSAWSGTDECLATLAATGTGDSQTVLLVVAIAILAGVAAVVLAAVRRRRDRRAG